MLLEPRTALLPLGVARRRGLSEPVLFGSCPEKQREQNHIPERLDVEQGTFPFLLPCGAVPMADAGVSPTLRLARAMGSKPGLCHRNPRA